MLPNLSSSRRVRLFAFTSFYVAQGLPLGLVTVAMPAWLASNGASASEVASFFAISSLPWALKLFAGPFMDRFRFPALGERRPWVMLAQTGLSIAFLSLAVIGDATSSLALLTAACFVVNTFAAVQDVAVDGMAIDVLPEEERGRANALMGFGQVAGISASGALCGWSLTTLGLSWTALILGIAVAAILSLAVLFRERAGEKLLPWTPGASQHEAHQHAVSWKAIFVNLFRVLVLPASLALFVVTLFWRVAHGIFTTAVPVLLTQDFGWETSDYTSWSSISTFVAAVLGVFVGPFIDRHGSRSFLVAAMASCTFVFVVLWLTSAWWDARVVWIIGMFAANLALQIVFVAYIALHMTICWSKVAATQFAIYMAYGNLMRSFGAMVYGEASPYLDTGQEPLLIAAFFMLAVMSMMLVSLERHRDRLNRLEAAEPTADLLIDVPARY